MRVYGAQRKKALAYLHDCSRRSVMLVAGELRYNVVIDDDRLGVCLREMNKLPANQGEGTSEEVGP